MTHSSNIVKPHETWEKHCDPLVKHRETLAIQCDNIDAQCSDTGTQHSNMGTRNQVSGEIGDCKVSITPQMCSWDMGIFSRPETA